VGGRLPDRTFVLLLDAASASRRLGPARDRIEREGDDFRARVNEAYGELARRFPERIVALDGSLAVEAVARAVREDLEAHV
jgi:dTMP kinase